MGLLLAMARAKRGINLRHLYERNGWGWRSAYRDVETLREAGVPIEHPEHGWFRVASNWLPAGTVDVSRAELLALFVARHLAPGLKSTVIGRGLDSIWSKLATPGHQQSLGFGDTWLRPPLHAAIDYEPHRIVFDAVNEATRTRRALAIRYRKPDGTETERTVEPAFVHWETSTEALYVRAWCRLRGAFRTFAVHRILDACVTAEEIAPRRDAETEMAKAYRLWARPTTEHVSLRFSSRVAGEVRERRWHATQRLADTDDGGVILEMDVGALDELERLVLGFGPDVVVEAPSSFAARIQERHAAAAGVPHFRMLRARTRTAARRRTKIAAH